MTDGIDGLRREGGASGRGLAALRKTQIPCSWVGQPMVVGDFSLVSGKLTT